jgi:hypothetical protein
MKYKKELKCEKKEKSILLLYEKKKKKKDPLLASFRITFLKKKM